VNAQPWHRFLLLCQQGGTHLGISQLMIHGQHFPPCEVSAQPLSFWLLVPIEVLKLITKCQTSHFLSILPASLFKPYYKDIFAPVIETRCWLLSPSQLPKIINLSTVSFTLVWCCTSLSSGNFNPLKFAYQIGHSTETTLLHILGGI